MNQEEQRLQAERQIDTEEDLLEMQKEFLKSNQKAAAKVVRKPPAVKSSSSSAAKPDHVPNTEFRVHDFYPPKEELAPGITSVEEAPEPPKKTKTSRFAQEREARKAEESGPAPSSSPSSAPEPKKRAALAPLASTSAFSQEVVERDVVVLDANFPKLVAPQSQGFPEVKHRSESNFKKSRLKAGMQASKSGVPKPDAPKNAEENDTGVLPVDILGLEDAKKIHAENKSTIEGMTPAEIEAARQEIAEMFGPASLEILKNLRKRDNKDQPPPLEDDSVPEVAPVPSSTPRTTTKAPEGGKDARKSEIHEKEIAEISERLKTDLGIDVSQFKPGDLEIDKLRWMMPQEGDSSRQKGKPAADLTHPLANVRFDFRGTIQKGGENPPTSGALYHHGDSPDDAGYNLGEIFHLLRSTVPSQRAISLQTLDFIFQKIKKGDYPDELCVKLFSAMEELNYVSYLRSSLDDDNNTVLLHSLNAVKSLITSASNEILFDQFLLTSVESCYLSPPPKTLKKTPKPDGTPDEPPGEKEFAEIDVVDTLLKTHLVARLAFLFQKVRNVNHIDPVLDILIRIARHSEAACQQIVDHPSLLATIHESFIKVPWPAKTRSEHASFGTPNKKALKLLRVLSQSGNQNTFTLLEKGYFGSSLRFLVAVISKDPLKEPASPESLELFLEVLGYWKVIAAYGYGMDAFTELLPLLTTWLKQLHEFNGLKKPFTQVSPGTDTLYFESQVMFFGLLELVAKVVVDPNCIETSQGTSFWGNLSTFAPSVALFLNDWIEGSHTAGLAPETVHPVLPYLITSSLSFLATFYQYAQFLPTFSPKEYEQVLQRVFETYWGTKTSPGLFGSFDRLAIPLLKDGWKHHRSTLGTAHKFPFLTGFPTLPGFYRKSTLAHLQSVLKIGCLLQYFSAKMLLAHCIAMLNRPLLPTVLQAVFSEETTLDLVASVIKEGTTETSSSLRNIGKRLRFFSLGERNFLRSWMSKRDLEGEAAASQDVATQLLSFRAALFLVNSSVPGDVPHVDTLLHKEIFNPTRLSRMASLLLQDRAACTKQGVDQHLLASLFSDPSEILVVMNEVSQETGEYLRGSLCYSKTRRDVGVMAPEGPSALSSLAVDMFDPKSTLPDNLEWPFLPISDLFAITVVEKRDLSKETEALESELQQAIRAIALLEGLAPELFKGVPVGSKITALMQLYLVDAQAFLNQKTDAILGTLLGVYTRSSRPHEWSTFSSPEGVVLPPQFIRFKTVVFSQLFSEFVRQYVAASFGNETFTQFLVLQLQSCLPRESRLAIWNDEAEVLQMITLPIDKVPAPDGLGSYLYPVEVSSVLLGAYSHALISQRVIKERNPFVYWFAVHHLSSYVFRDEVEIRPTKFHEDEPIEQKDLLRSLLLKLPTPVAHDLILYHNTPLASTVMIPLACYSRLEFRIQSRVPKILADFEGEPTTLAKARSIASSLPAK